ncbi:hypothetical protein G4228_012788 [Cervus hanglu yarkandensis]|nr:hypothetical protein G4228_012788 [Cervus hanglu yarkandensis]
MEPGRTQIRLDPR